MARRAAACDLSKSKLLRQARNKAYYERKKHMKQIQRSLKAARARSSGGKGDSEGTQAQYPITPPRALCALESAHLTVLNSRLQAWGYREEPRDHLDTLKAEIKKARRRSGGVDAWIKDTLDWLEEGNGIVLAMEQMMGREGVQGLHPTQVKKMWQTISSTAFNAQFMIAMTTVKLDEVEGYL
ncbi:hypothetical protein OH76DRAFT_1486436 [Lentinus brumalis]|uniref:Uncharacterized protein n=1 Tax=Lentinus brumalis TaxID=2498619 RepID=A0A371CYB0_9APHY|nr:hypothetical protein OH76DRAFT_1486436 [Polyporus brumalis]